MKMTNEQCQRLIKAQNSQANNTQDIMTFTSFFETQEQLEAHIQRYERRAAIFESLTEKQKNYTNKDNEMTKKVGLYIYFYKKHICYVSKNTQIKYVFKKKLN